MKLSDLQENRERQFNKIRKGIHRKWEIQERNKNHWKEPDRNFGAEEFNEWNKNEMQTINNRFNQIRKIESVNYRIET